MGLERPVIVLYSASPRRRELLEKAGLPYVMHPVDADETIPGGMSSPEVVMEIARRKLEAGMVSAGSDGLEWGLAADTLVEGPEGLLGKPADYDEAGRMLESLSGISHQVHSGIALRAPVGSGSFRTVFESHSTMVRFRKLDRSEIVNYLNTGEWEGAAGAYRIQDRGELLVEHMEGLWSTVVGLPLGPLYGILSAMSYPMG